MAIRHRRRVLSCFLCFSMSVAFFLLNLVLLSDWQLTSFSDDVIEPTSPRPEPLILPSLVMVHAHWAGGGDKSWTPRLVVSGQRRNVSIVIGIPTVWRWKDNYLLQTLTSLFENMNPEEKADCLLVLCVAEIDEEKSQWIVQNVTNTFSEEVGEGLLDIIAPHPSFYPDFEELPLNLASDKRNRTTWRSKGNLDKAFTMLYSMGRGKYFLQLEDDVISQPGFLSTMRDVLDNDDNAKYLMYHFCHLGAIAKLVRNEDLASLSLYLLHFYNFQPNDWLLNMFIYLRHCPQGSDERNCYKRALKEYVYFHRNSLFQHIGKKSSLFGASQPLVDKSFKAGKRKNDERESKKYEKKKTEEFRRAKMSKYLEAIIERLNNHKLNMAQKSQRNKLQ